IQKAQSKNGSVQDSPYTAFECSTCQPPPHRFGIAQKTQGLSIRHFASKAYSKYPENGQDSGHMGRKSKEYTQTEGNHSPRDHGSKRTTSNVATKHPSQHHGYSWK